MAGRLLRLMPFLLILVLVMPVGLKAATVGRFVQVEGQVDLLKGGQLPVTKAAAQQPVDQGDVVRTKAISRAQIQFVDETVLTIGPSSRIAIEDYVFDAAQGKRSATIEIFRGLVQTVVKKIYQMEEPDFVVKTHTSVLGVRGTKWYTQLLPTSTDVYTEEAGTVTKLGGKPGSKAGLEVKNIFPEIPGSVILKAMQFTRVGVDLPPTLPVNITEEDLKYLQTWMNIESGASSPTSQTPESSATASQTPPTGGLSTMPTTVSTTGGSLVSPTYLPRTTTLDSPAQYFASGFYVPPEPGSAPVPSPEPPAPPVPPVPPVPPTPTTYYFTQSWFGTFVFQSEYPFTQGTAQGWGWGQRTGVYDGYYSATYSHTRLPDSGQTFSSNFLPGTTTGTMEGSVTGTLGQTLSGTMTFTGNLAIGGTFDYSGNVTLEPSGAMVFNYSGTRANQDGSSSGTTTNGVMNFHTGTYFKQTVDSFPYQTGTFPPYWLATTTGDQISGVREGYSPGPFTASFRANTWSSQLYNYEPETGNASLTMEGVLSGSPEGVMTGAMTATAVGPDGFVSEVGGPVYAYPDSTMVAEFYGSRYTDSGTVLEKDQGMWIQTSDPTAGTVTANYSGSVDPWVSTPPYNTATTTGIGRLVGSGIGGGGHAVGTYSGTATGPDNTFDPIGDPSEISFIIAGVGRQTSPEGLFSGQIFGTGLYGNNVWLYSDPNNPGTFTLQPDNTGTITLNNLWKEATLGGGTKFGTGTSNISATPGTYFSQVAGPGSLTYTSNDSTDFTVQNIQLTDGVPITNGTGTLGNFIVTNLSGTRGVVTGNTNVFPAQVVSPDSTIYTRGVIGPGGTGAMELTVVDATGWYRARGAALQTSGTNLQGINLLDSAYYGPNRVPTSTVLQYQQTPTPTEVVIVGPIQAAQ